jgi:hypothetical protein
VDETAKHNRSDEEVRGRSGESTYSTASVDEEGECEKRRK